MEPADLVDAPPPGVIVWSIVAAGLVLASVLWSPVGRTLGLLVRIAWLYFWTGAQG